MKILYTSGAIDDARLRAFGISLQAFAGYIRSLLERDNKYIAGTVRTEIHYDPAKALYSVWVYGIHSWEELAEEQTILESPAI